MFDKPISFPVVSVYLWVCNCTAQWLADNMGVDSRF